MRTQHRIVTHLAAAAIGAAVVGFFPSTQSERPFRAKRAGRPSAATDEERRPRPIVEPGRRSTAGDTDDSSKASGARPSGPPDEIGPGPAVATDTDERFDVPWEPPAQRGEKTPRTRPPTMPEIRSAKMTAILVEANLRRPGTESERLLKRLEEIKSEVRASLEPVHRKLLAELQFVERSFELSPDERDRGLRLARRRALDAMLAVGSDETAMIALAISPSLASAGDE